MINDTRRHVSNVQYDGHVRLSDELHARFISRLASKGQDYAIDQEHIEYEFESQLQPVRNCVRNHVEATALTSLETFCYGACENEIPTSVHIIAYLTGENGPTVIRVPTEDDPPSTSDLPLSSFFLGGVRQFSLGLWTLVAPLNPKTVKALKLPPTCENATVQHLFGFSFPGNLLLIKRSFRGTIEDYLDTDLKVCNVVVARCVRFKSLSRLFIDWYPAFYMPFL